MSAAGGDVQRLDRWLWGVRLFKTRALAVEAIRNGRVELNGERAKPAKNVRVGDAVRVRRPPYVHDLEVLGLTPRRVSATLARELYVETQQSVAAREALAERLELDRVVEARRWGKLNKKERRERERLKRSGE